MPRPCPQCGYHPQKTPIIHGTVSGYTNKRCRCAECRKANTDYSKNRRERLRKEALDGKSTT